MARPPVMLLLCGAVLAGQAGCREQAQRPRENAGWYRGSVIPRANTEIPFFLHIPDDCASESATIVNGEEPIPVPCQRRAEQMVVEFPVYGTYLEASLGAAGELSGLWYRQQSDGRKPIMVFEARPIPAPDPRLRIAEPPDGEPAGNFDGTWHVNLDRRGTARAVFAQRLDGEVTGTMEIPTKYGDLRFLSGSVRGRALEMSSFDGQDATVMQAQLTAKGRLRGRLEWHWIGGSTSDTFSAERAEEVTLPDPLSRVVPTHAAQAIDFALFERPLLVDKPVIVDIFGTWCPNCGDHVRALTDIYQRYHPHGLEILGLAFEFADTETARQERVEAFKSRYSVPWSVLISETTLEEGATELGLSAIEGVPVTVFVKRDGSIHSVYTGFPGPATGDAHDRALAVFETLTREIVFGVQRHSTN